LANVLDIFGAQDVEGGGADAGHRAGPLPDPTVVLAQGHIPNVMIAIFNSPVRANGAGEGLGIEADLAGVIADLLARRPQAGPGVLLEGQARDAGDQRLPLGVQLVSKTSTSRCSWRP
jgi:hypothetical protein